MYNWSMNTNHRLNLYIDRKLVVVAKMEASRRGISLTELIEESLVKNIQSQKIIDSVNASMVNPGHMVNTITEFDK